MLFRRPGGLSATLSGRLRRSLSTGAAASRPPWAMISRAILKWSPDLRASFKLAEPPCASHIVVPDHFVDSRPHPDPDGDTLSVLGGVVRAVSGDGLLLLHFRAGRATAPIVGYHGTSQARRLVGIHDMDPDITRFVCNPLSGQLVRLPDIDGTKKASSSSCKSFGILTHSERPHLPPDRYAVAELVEDNQGMEGSFLMRRFLSPTREWEKLMGLPSPLPVGHRRHKIDHGVVHEVVAFAGRLWWVDVSWGAITADPFSDRPELRFVELPRGSLTEPMEMLGRYRRMGISEGRLHYAEVSQKEPFLLSSFVLENDGSWTLQHRVALTRLWGHSSDLCEDKPRIGVIDPLNSSIMHLTVGNRAFSVDMIRWKVLGCCVVVDGADPPIYSADFLKPCVLPPWLGSSHIPSTGTLSSNRASVKSKNLSDILVRVGRDEKN